MKTPERTVALLSLMVAPPRRARFVEEWRADLAAARSIGLGPREVLLAAARVAALLLWLRLRDEIVRPRPRWQLLGVGVLLGFVLVITDASLEYPAVVAAAAVGWRCWKAIRAWIEGSSVA